jgi:hypothetical protein
LLTNIANAEGILNKSREEWIKKNAEEYTPDPDINICGSCKQQLPAEKVNGFLQEATHNFNMNKRKALELITQSANAVKDQLQQYKESAEALKVKIEETNIEINKTEANINALRENLQRAKTQPFTTNPKIDTLQAEHDAIFLPDIKTIDSGEITAQKTQLTNTIHEYKMELGKVETIKNMQQRIETLMAEETTYAQQLAELEKQEFLLQDFLKLKISNIEQQINSRFTFVKFKMFEQQLNGGEVECCECLLSGVPFTDANTAGKINAGLDIINTFANHYNMHAPIWIDNKESINTIIDVASQVITLNVSTDKFLTIK